MFEHPDAELSLITEMAGAAAAGVGGASATYAVHRSPTSMSRARPEMKLDLARTALVVIDPYTDLLSPKGAAWSALGGSRAERKMVWNLGRLFNASKLAGITVAVSLTAGSFRGSGFMPELKPYIEGDTSTLICSPHKRYSPLPPVNDSGLQLRRHGVRQIILAGLIANLSLESHLRDFLEQGFEVVVVRDAIAGPKHPEGDGYLSTLVNFRHIANALWTTEQAVETLGLTGCVPRLNAKEYAR